MNKQNKNKVYWYCWGTCTYKQVWQERHKTVCLDSVMCSLDAPAGMNAFPPQQLEEGAQPSFLCKGRLLCSRSHLSSEVPHNPPLTSVQVERRSPLAATQDTSEGPPTSRTPMGLAEGFGGPFNFSLAQTCFLLPHSTNVDAKALPNKGPAR